MITCVFESGRKAFLRHLTVGALLIRKNKILLVKRAQSLTEGGKYDLPGGYLEKDENFREGLLREIKEETGYTAKVLKLFRLNGNPHRKNDPKQNIALTYLAKPLKKIGSSDEEVEKVSWFDLNKLPASSQIAFDQQETIALYKRYLKNKFKLPILEDGSIK